MATQEVAIKQTVNITLKSDAEVLEEVVVTGYGVQRKASFTGAAAIIGEDVIAKKSDANFVKALEGAVPGVQMSNSTSMPVFGRDLCSWTWFFEFRHSAIICNRWNACQL